MWFLVEDVVEQRSHKFFSRALFAVVMVLAIACGKDSQQGIPTADLPPGTGPTTPLSSDPRDDARLPSQLRGSTVGITLADPTSFSGLLGITGWAIFPQPLVETFFSLTIPNETSTNVSSQAFLGFEYGKGFWYTLMNTFSSASTLTTSQMDFIYTDSKLTLRVTAGINGNSFIDPKISYRVRQSGETQCQVTTGVCKDQWGNVYPPSYCGITPVDDAAVCKSYMNLGNSAVKPLGTFSAATSQWLN